MVRLPHRAVRAAYDAEQLAIYRPAPAAPIRRPRPSPRRGWSAAAAAGKSFTLALIAVFLACFHDYRQHLAPGERGTLMVIAADRQQARIIMRYVRGFLTNIPMLERMIEREAAEHFDLNNRISIEIGTVSFKTSAAIPLSPALLDELGVLADRRQRQPRLRHHRRDPPRHGDHPERHAAVRFVALRAQRRVVGRASSASRPGRTIRFWSGRRRPATMNPSVPQRVDRRRLRARPRQCCRRVWRLFRSDVESLLTREVVDAAVVPGRRELAPASGVRYRRLCRSLAVDLPTA